MNRNKKILIAIAILILISSTYFVRKINQSTQPHLTVVGSVVMADGLGKQAAELIEALKDDITIGFRPHNKNIVKGDIPDSIHDILKNRSRPIGKVVIFEDYFGKDGLCFKEAIKGLKNDNYIRIAYSMFESSQIPSEWVVALNHYFDAVAVPDEFLIEVYKNSGVTIPIFELPLGLNLKQFLNVPLKINKKTPFIFANMSAAIPRKNQLKLIQAFHSAFGNSCTVKLRINSRHSDPDCAQLIKDEIHKLGVTNIEFTEMRMEKDLYFKVFQDIDCYVSLSLGEGFSIQPREAMALGIPIIITDTTGQSTICKSHLGYKIPCFNPISAFFPEFKNYYGIFYDCQIEDVTKALRDVYINYEHYLRQGLSAREWVKQYSYDQLKPLYLSLINPKQIILCKKNQITPDCLFIDSKELCNKFHHLLGTPFEDQR